MNNYYPTEWLNISLIKFYRNLKLLLQDKLKKVNDNLESFTN